MKDIIEHRGIKIQYKKLKKNIDKRVLSILEKGSFIEGSEVKDLEKMLANYVGVKHCITCGNGTDSIYLLLKSLNIGEKDAVMVPAFTYFATAEAIAKCGATPVFVDVDILTYNISPYEIKKTIENYSFKEGVTLRAIVTVDLFGQCADYTSILPILEQNNILLIEDAAQSFGAKIGNRNALSFGCGGALSFFPTKPLGCYGDGGAIFTNSDQINTFVRSYKSHGAGIDKYNNIMIGTNSRLDTIQAGILIEKLKVFKDEQKRLFLISKRFNRAFKKHFRIPFIPKGFTSVYAQYTIRCQSQKQRQFLLKYLNHKKIPAFVYYNMPLHLQPAFKYLGYKKGDMPISEALSNTVISIPIHPYLSKNQQSKIINTLIKGSTLYKNKQILKMQ